MLTPLTPERGGGGRAERGGTKEEHGCSVVREIRVDALPALEGELCRPEQPGWGDL